MPIAFSVTASFHASSRVKTLVFPSAMPLALAPILTTQEFGTRSKSVTEHGGALREPQSELLRRQLSCGAWAALASSGQASIEPTCYSLLALESTAPECVSRGQSFLLDSQNPNGSWPVFSGDDEDGSWVTALAAVALRDVVPAIPARLRRIIQMSRERLSLDHAIAGVPSPGRAGPI